MNRPHKIGASDAKTIAFGSDEDLIEMANRIREGKEMKFNKNHRFLMDLGTAVEPVTMKRFNDDVTTLADEQVTLTWDQDKRVGCILDGLTVDHLPVEAKFHTGSKDIWQLAEYYNAQLQHQMMLHGSERCWFTATFGMYGKFGAIEVQADKAFQDQYLFRLLAFLQLLDGEKIELPKIEKPKPPSPKTHYWDTSDNHITALCHDFIENEAPAKTFEKAKADLKEEFPADHVRAIWKDETGLCLTMNRSRNGAIRIGWEQMEVETSE